jgi:F-type H+-transporting ATPase subunit gamma
MRGYGIVKNYDGASQYPSMRHAYRIAHELIDLYLYGDAADVYVLFTDYVSAADQPVVTHRLLPLKAENFERYAPAQPYEGRMTYEPSVETAYERMVMQYVQGYLYGCLCSANVCENMARMSAMQSATRNADEMLKKLETAYNTMRQLTITNELTEIAAATELINKSI